MTTASQEPRARDMGRYFDRMPDAATASRDEAARTTAYLNEISPEMRGCAVLSGQGELLAASGEDAERWQAPAREAIEAIDSAGGEPASHAHIATSDGEVFMVREGDLVCVAVTDRFALASLVLFDLRIALRDLAGES
jgi:hypothetical protein